METAKQGPFAEIDRLLDLGDEEGAAGKLADLVSAGVAQDLRGALDGYLERFAPEVIACNPRLWMVSAVVEQLHGNLAEAEARMLAAYRAFLAQEEPGLAFFACSFLFQIRRWKGQGDAAADLVADLLALEPHAPEEARLHMRGFLGAFYLFRGEFSRARETFRGILAAPHLGRPTVGLVHHRVVLVLGELESLRGDALAAGQLYQKAIDLGTQCHLDPSRNARAKVMLAEVSLRLGNRTLADQLLAEAIADATDDPSAQIDMVGSRLNILMLEGELDAAWTLCRETLARIRRALPAEDSWNEGHLISLQAMVEAMRGRASRALELHDRCQAYFGKSIWRAQTLMDWAQTLILAGRIEAAEAKLLQAEKILANQEPLPWHADLPLIRAVLRHRSGHDDEAFHLLSRAVDVLQEASLVPLVVSPIAAEFWRLLARGGHQGVLRRIQALYPWHAEAIAAAIGDPAEPAPTSPPLSIRCLGILEVEVGGRIAHWPRRKAKALLAWLAIVPEGLCRQELQDRLYPGLDPRAADNELDKLVFELRRILEPDRVARQPARFLVARGGRFSLLTVDVWLDLQEFQAAYAEALSASSEDAAITACERAALLARGELFADPELQEWFAVERHFYHIRILEVLERLAAHHLGGTALTSRPEAGGAVPERGQLYAERILGFEPCHEGAHRLLMAHFARQGLFAMARRQYDLCAAALARDLEAEPSPETRALLRDVAGLCDPSSA